MAGDIPYLFVLWSWIRLFSEAISTSNFSMCWPVLLKIQCFFIFTQKPWWYYKYVSCPCTRVGTNLCDRIHYDGLFRGNTKGTCQWFFLCFNRVRAICWPNRLGINLPTRDHWGSACGICWWMRLLVWHNPSVFDKRDSCMTGRSSKAGCFTLATGCAYALSTYAHPVASVQMCTLMFTTPV